MTALVESPVPVILLGILAEAVLGVALLKTGRGVLLWAMGGVLVGVLAGVVLERVVVTERERIEAALEGVAAAVAANDKDAALVHIHPSAAGVRRMLDWGFRQAEFTDAKITSLEVLSINELISPPTARVHLKGIVSFEQLGDTMPYEHYPPDLTVELALEGDRWLVTGYEFHNDPRG